MSDDNYIECPHCNQRFYSTPPESDLEQRVIKIVVDNIASNGSIPAALDRAKSQMKDFDVPR